MTAKELVQHIYPKAKFYQYNTRKNLYSAIKISDSPFKCIGWCGNKTEEQTWEYANKDLNYIILRKLEE